MADSVQVAVLALLPQLRNRVEGLAPIVERWVPTGASGARVRGVREPAADFAHRTLALDRSGLEDTAEYKAYATSLEADTVLSSAPLKVGYSGQPYQLLIEIVRAAVVSRRGVIRISDTAIKKAVRSVRSILQAKSLPFTARARLVGVDLRTRSRSLEIARGVELSRLTPSERHEEVLVASRRHGLSTSDVHETTEIRCALKVTVDPEADGSLHTAYNSADVVAREMMSRVVQAVRLARPGVVTHGWIQIDGGIGYYNSRMGHLTTEAFALRGKILRADANRIRVAYCLVDQRNSDKVLRAALRSFDRGRERRKPEDQIVDYVTAWESLLISGGARGGFGYRFRVHGAALLQHLGIEHDQRLTLRRMRSAYATRSKLVHGGGSDATKAAKAGRFETLYELANYLESSLRQAIFKLEQMPRDERPHAREGAWEELLFR